MKKRIVASVLVLAMVLGLAGCGQTSNGGNGSTTTTVSGETEEVVINGITYNKALDLTEDKITLTYFHFDQDETVDYLARRFEELYPNITVNDVYENVATYNDTLNALIDNGEAPDVIMFSDCFI